MATTQVSEGVRSPRFSVQRWLDTVPREYLADTWFGTGSPGAVPEIVTEPGLLREVYLMDLALFVSAERTSVQVAAGLTRLAEHEDERVFLATQVLDEARHYEMFAHRLAALGVDDERREQRIAEVTTRPLADFQALLLEQVDRGDYVAGMVAHNVILEGMAFPLYGYEERYWRPFDPDFCQMINGAFRDETRHVAFGETSMRRLLAGDPARRAQIARLVRDASRLVGDMFEHFVGYFVGYYQEALRQHADRVRDLEIFPGRLALDTPVDEQIHLLLDEIRRVHARRMVSIGLDRSVVEAHS